MIITKQAFPRAALIGNPSDGFFGKTIAFVFDDYCAEVQIYETPELDLLPSLRDHASFASMEHLVEDVSLHGYYGGIRLLKASIKKFYEYCQAHAIALDDRNFTLRYDTTIPNRLGLAGSSAIITACLRALMAFFEVEMSKPILANVTLSVEVEELGINAGLQDRVAQAYETPVFMDFDKALMESRGYGEYTPISLEKIPNLFVAYRTDLAEGSEILHGHLREDYEKGLPQVRDAMIEWAALTDKALVALETGDQTALAQLMDRNFDLRCEVCSNVSPKNKQMVELARSVGASAKFTGSGGAIIGLYQDEATYETLARSFAANKIGLLKPHVVMKG